MIKSFTKYSNLPTYPKMLDAKPIYTNIWSPLRVSVLEMISEKDRLAISRESDWMRIKFQAYNSRVCHVLYLTRIYLELLFRSVHKELWDSDNCKLMGESWTARYISFSTRICWNTSIWLRCLIRIPNVEMPTMLLTKFSVRGTIIEAISSVRVSSWQ